MNTGDRLNVRDPADSMSDDSGRYRLLFESMTELAVFHKVVYDGEERAVDYVLLDVNPAFCRSLGMSRERVVGRLATEVYGVPEAPCLGRYAHVAETGEPDSFEVHFAPVDRYYNVSAISPAKGFFYTISLDITDRKRVETDRDRLFAELERKNDDLARYLYITSHDLRSPLVNVEGFTDRLAKSADELRGIVSGLPEDDPVRERALAALGKMPKAMGYIVSSTERMERLIAGLLKLSRTGRVEMKVTALDMDALVADAVRSLGHQVEESAASIDIRPLPPCSGDAELLSAAFSNLLDNAIKYRRDGVPLTVTVSGEAAAERVVYRVDDSGRGVPADQRARVFDFFYRYDPKGTAMGEGIGLSRVKMIVERHGGTVSIGESPSGGARVELSLPVAPPPAAATKKGSARRP